MTIRHLMGDVELVAGHAHMGLMRVRGVCLG